MTKLRISDIFKVGIGITLLVIIIILIGGLGGGKGGDDDGSKGVDSDTIPPPATSVPLINVYLENSGSMNGYVAGITELERDLKSYLLDINKKSLADSMSLNYINDRIIFQGNDVDAFIKNLEPSSFIEQGGNTATTDIAGVLKMVLEKTNHNSVSLFISDCIISPGKKIKETQLNEYLKDQQLDIEYNFSMLAQKKGMNLGVIVYQMYSKFDGTYYNRVDARTKIKEARPYYLWLVGDTKYLKLLTQNIDINKLDGSLGEASTFSIFETSSSPAFQILQNPKRGDFTRNRSNPYHIHNIKKDTKAGSDVFMFSLGVNFSDYLLDENYLLSLSNYKLNSTDYTLSIAKQGIGSEYRMQLETSIISQLNLSIGLLMSKPTWIANANDDIGLDIYAPNAMSQTYGIKYILDGVYDAFSDKGTKNTYSTIDIKLN